MKGKTIMTNVDALIGGIDSHKDTIHVAVITSMGHEIDDREFPTTQAGYRHAIAWLVDHGQFGRTGVEANQQLRRRCHRGTTHGGYARGRGQPHASGRAAQARQERSP
jgi:hypothetical protein